MHKGWISGLVEGWIKGREKRGWMDRYKILSHFFWGGGDNIIGYFFLSVSLYFLLLLLFIVVFLLLFLFLYNESKLLAY